MAAKIRKRVKKGKVQGKKLVKKVRRPKLEDDVVDPRDLKPHPRNYNAHPEDQIEHLVASIREHGVYKNIVVARDNTILAGHGMVEAAVKAKEKTVPVKRIAYDPDDPRAIKLVAGDNEVNKLSDVDDRALSELLAEIKDKDPMGLLGTGFDEQRLANLVFVTRSAAEIADFDAAAHWVGMPEYGDEDLKFPYKLVVSFQKEEDRDDFIRKTDIVIDKKAHKTWSTRWPFVGSVDTHSVKYKEKKEKKEKEKKRGRG
jgi:hypothetical protein